MENWENKNCFKHYDKHLTSSWWIIIFETCLVYNHNFLKTVWYVFKCAYMFPNFIEIIINVISAQYSYDVQSNRLCAMYM